MAFLAAAKIRAFHLLRSWLAILIALYAATFATGAGFLVALFLVSTPLPAATFAALPVWLLLVAIYGLFAALIFAVLATPFLMLQRFIVGSRAPYLRPGYAVVMVYGPALVVLFTGDWTATDWAICAAYEAVALIATLLYVRLAGAFALFPPEPDAEATAA